MMMQGIVMKISIKLIEEIRLAKNITVLTGAGISKESGIPTFREAQTGLWAQYDPTELASPQAFRKNPELVWNWYQWRRDMIKKTSPNPAHYALVEMEKQVSGFTLITQNVDGLHMKAGSHNLIEIHGNIMLTKCFDQGHMVESWPVTNSVPPKCPKCGSYLRPDVVWFGENLSSDALERSQMAAAKSNIFFSIGTSALVHPAASLPLVALQANSIVVEINPDHTPLTEYVNFNLKGSAGEILPKLMQQVWGNQDN